MAIQQPTYAGPRRVCMRRSAPRGALLASAVVLVLSGCADSSAHTHSAGTPGPVDARCQRVAHAAHWEGVVRAGSAPTALDQYDDYFAPTCIKVPWNRRVTLVVTNFGHMPHTVTVQGMPVDVDVD